MFDKPLPDMVEMTDTALGDLARAAFLIGLKDGRELAGPITADKLWSALPGHPRRKPHSRKLRQVYGAGFDIGKLNAELLAKVG